MTRRYSDLIGLDTLEARYNYLRLGGVPAQETFGAERWLNQQFYVSREWKEIRDHIQIRDMGCDLGIPGFEIHDRPYVHHLNPMTPHDLRVHNPAILDPENLILTTHRTHNAIHYGTEKQLPRPFVERRPGDTLPWR